MDLVIAVGVTAAALGVFSGVAMGFHWGWKDGYRDHQLETAYDEGQRDHGSMMLYWDCPYELDEGLINAWQNGWCDADRRIA